MVLKNYIYNLIYQILVILLPIITIPYVSRVLGAEGIGIYALASTYAQYFIFLGMLGLSMYSSREIAYVRDDSEKLSKTFWELNGIRFITMSISIIIYLLIFGVLYRSNDRIIYIIQSIVLFSSLIDISWLFIGLENFKKVVLRNTVVKIIGVLLIFLLVKNKSDIWLYTLILSGTQFLGQMIMWFDIPKTIKFYTPNIKSLNYHLKNSIPLFIPQIAISVYTMLDKIMLGFFTNETQVGLYDNSQRVIKILVVIVTTLSTVTIPKMSNLYKNRKYKEFENNVYKSFSFVSFIAFPMTLGLIAILKTFIPWFYGDGFEDIVPMFYIGSFLMITLGWSSILGNQVLISIKREKQFTIAVTCGAIVNLMLNFVLIKNYQGVGATISSLIAEYTGMFIMAYNLRDILDIKKLFSSTPRYIISSIIMYLIIQIVGLNMSTTIISTFVQVVIGIISYMLIMFIIKDENLLYVWSFINKIKRRKLE